MLIKHIRPVHYADHWSILPFNGQAIRLQKIVEIATVLRPTIVIETGTYLGSSTPYLASFASNKTFTIEIDKNSAAKAHERFKAHHGNSRIELILDDSAVAIQKILEGLDSRSETVLAYLDAHWLDAIPTKTELQSLCDWGGNWIAIIDDFQVPHDPGYAYDEYENTVIGISEVPLNRNLQVWVPNILAEKETGAKRGTGYIFSPEAIKVIPKSVFESLIEIR
jgi:predicted O-methyltransferase YrrM